MHSSNAQRSEIKNLSQLASESLLQSLMGTLTLMFEHDSVEEDFDVDTGTSTDISSIQQQEGPQIESPEELRSSLAISFKKKHWDFSSIHEPIDLLLTFSIPESGVEDLQALREHIPDWDGIVFGQIQSTLLLLQNQEMATNLDQYMLE